MGTGVTAQTWENLVLDTAVAYLDYGESGERILGATNGGVSFGWADFQTRQPEIDGLKGPIMGASRITRAVPQVSVNLVEWSLENLLLGLPGAVMAVTGAGAAQITTLTRSARLIPVADYITNVALVGTLSGETAPIVILVKNALILDGFSLPTNPDSEATAELVFVGHYDSASPEAEPWEIRYPTPAEE